PVGRTQRHERGADVFEADQTPDRRPFDHRLALNLEAELDEERFHGFEIVDDDEDVVHSFDCQVHPSPHSAPSGAKRRGIQCMIAYWMTVSQCVCAHTSTTESLSFHRSIICRVQSPRTASMAIL